MARKLYDLAVKTSEYTDRDGQTKGRWQNVGAVMQGDDGNQFVMLARWFNPAGVDARNGGESILLSCFEPKQQGQQAPAQTAQRQAAQPRQQQAPMPDTDDIPF